MGTSNLRSVWKGWGTITGWVFAAVIAVAFLGLTPEAYCQQSSGGGGQSLWETIYKGGPAGAWIPHPENPWLQGLRITGLLQNTSGIWVNPHGVQTGAAPFYAGRSYTNELATERNFLQVDTNYDLDGRNHFFFRFWGVYEPSYPDESDFRSVAAQALNKGGNKVGCFPPGIPGLIGFTHCTASSAADFYNRAELRELWWRLSLGPLRIFTGRQIVTWGESLAFRIADVVNPQDLSWNFGFANLEQSRIPQWMLHPILELPEYGPFTQNFLEGIWEPPIQFNFANFLFNDTPDRRYRGANANGASVNVLAPFGGRFDVQTQAPFGGEFGFPSPSTDRHGPFGPGTAPGTGFAAYPQASFFSLFLPPDVISNWNFPTTQLRFSQEGIRIHTLINQLVEATVLYWHGHQYFPSSRLQTIAPAFDGDPRPIMRLVNFFPELNDIGFTANLPLNIPGQIGSMLPFVVRTEGVWQDRTPFATRDPTNLNGLKYSSTINTLVALDADQIYAPWLTSTGGSLTMNVEWNNFTILSPSKFLEQGPFNFQQSRHNEESFIFAASTSWWWQSIAPQWVMVFNPDGNTFLLFPNIALVPPWTSQYFMKLQYIGVISDNIQDGASGGILKGKNFILAQFQWNFNLL